MTVEEFMKLCDKLARDVAPHAKIIAVHKVSSIYCQEAEFTIRVSFEKDDNIEPDVIVEKETPQ